VWESRERGKGSWQRPSFCAFGVHNLRRRTAEQHAAPFSTQAAAAAAAHGRSRALGCSSCKQDLPCTVCKRECCSVCIWYEQLLDGQQVPVAGLRYLYHIYPHCRGRCSPANELLDGCFRVLTRLPEGVQVCAPVACTRLHKLGPICSSHDNVAS
jgi:hypothetical protein